MGKIVMTVCYLITNSRILLGWKKTSLGAGLYNGPGGKVDPKEQIDENAIREFGEETGGMNALALTKVGIILITYEESDLIAELHLFRVTKWNGEPQETREMIPEWFPTNRIPYPQMWPNDSHSLPCILSGKMVAGHFHLDSPTSRQIIRYWLDEVEQVPDSINPNRL